MPGFFYLHLDFMLFFQQKLVHFFKCKNKYKYPWKKVPLKKLIYLTMSPLGLKTNTKEESIHYSYPERKAHTIITQYTFILCQSSKKVKKMEKVTFFPLHKFVNG